MVYSLLFLVFWCITRHHGLLIASCLSQQDGAASACTLPRSTCSVPPSLVEVVGITQTSNTLESRCAATNYDFSI